MVTRTKRKVEAADSEQAVSPCGAPTRTAPTLEWDSDSEVTVRATEDNQIQRLYATRTPEAAAALFRSALNAIGQNGREYADLLPAMAVEMEPQDAVEAMLINQMTVTHLAITIMSQRMRHAQTPQTMEAYERSMTRLSRTFVQQVEQLKKYRAKAQQTVRVERVEVKDGGQAVVGDVTYGRGAHDET